MFCKKNVVVFLTTFVLVGCGYRDPDDYARRIQQHLPSEWQARAFFDTSRPYEGKTLAVEACSRQNGVDFKVVVWKSPQTGHIRSIRHINGQTYNTDDRGHLIYESNQPIPPLELIFKSDDGLGKVVAARDAVGW
jgi:hypothetical protein